MARGVTKKTPKQEPEPVATGPDHLTMNLFAPGMSALHRAGLGGLACTLKAMQRHHENGLLSDAKLPGPVVDGEYPWEITERSVTLRFGKPEMAKKYFQRLFGFGFQLRDGLIYLVGQYSEIPPSFAVRAEMQSALTRSILQGAKKNIGLEKATTTTCDIDGCGSAGFNIDIQRCNWYLHQYAWMAIVNNNTGMLLDIPIDKGDEKINYGSLYPGAIKRHDALKESDINDSVIGLICVAFGLVGILAMKLSGSGDGLLLVPAVDDLTEFISVRPLMTPQAVSDLRVGGTADGAYLLEARLRARSLYYATTLTECHSIYMSMRTWTKPQKSRIDTQSIDSRSVSLYEPDMPTLEERRFSQYEKSLALLPRGFRFRKDGGVFWTDSTIRPFIASNLAKQMPWYHQFNRFTNTTEKRQKLTYQRKGLGIMIAEKEMLDDNERVVIDSVKIAMREIWRKIEYTYKDQESLMMKKIDDEREKWGRVFSNSLSLPVFRKGLAEMFRRGTPSEGKPNWELQKNSQEILAMLKRGTWQKARDLTLIALSACYFSKTTN